MYTATMARRDLDEWMLQVAADFQRHTSGRDNPRARVASQRDWAPRVDLLEAENHFVVRLELAGVEPSAVSVHFDAKRHTLVVRGGRSDQLCKGDERYNPLQLEIETGAFTREIALPHVQVDVSAAQASWTNGLLQLVVPKVAMPDDVVEIRRITIERIK